jgi:RNase P/RNase MRP subunit POP5
LATGLHSTGIVTATQFSVIGFSLACVAFILSIQQKHLYISALLGSIQSHRVNLLEIEEFSPGKLSGKNEIRWLQEALKSSDAVKQLIALEFCALIKNEALFTSIGTFQRHPDPQKRLLAFQAIADNQAGLEEICLQALQDPEVEIRCEAIKRIRKIENGRELRGLLENQLKDLSPQVIGETIITLYRDSDLDAGLKKRIDRQIDEMLDGDAESRFQACRTIEAIKATQYAARVRKMAEEEISSRICGVAVKCLGGLGCLEAVPWLLAIYSDADRAALSTSPEHPHRNFATVRDQNLLEHGTTFERRA